MNLERICFNVVTTFYQIAVHFTKQLHAVVLVHMCMHQISGCKGACGHVLAACLFFNHILTPKHLRSKPATYCPKSVNGEFLYQTLKSKLPGQMRILWWYIVGNKGSKRTSSGAEDFLRFAACCSGRCLICERAGGRLETPKAQSLYWRSSKKICTV